MLPNRPADHPYNKKGDFHLEISLFHVRAQRSAANGFHPSPRLPQPSGISGHHAVGRTAAIVGGIPGVTKGVSWFGGNGFLLVDSPGILDPHADARAHRMISWIGSSRSQVIGSFEEHAKDCIEFLIRKDLWSGVEKLWGISPEGAPVEILEQVGRRLGRLAQGGTVDMEGAGRAFLDALANGRFGRMSFERPGDAPLWEEL